MVETMSILEFKDSGIEDYISLVRYSSLDQDNDQLDVSKMFCFYFTKMLVFEENNSIMLESDSGTISFNDVSQVKVDAESIMLGEDLKTDMELICNGLSDAKEITLVIL